MGHISGEGLLKEAALESLVSEGFDDYIKKKQRRFMSKRSMIRYIVLSLVLVVAACDRGSELEAAGPEAAELAVEDEAGEPGGLVQNEEAKMSIYDFSVETISGEQVNLSEYAGEVLLVVNVASECGYTPQYEGLQELWTRYQEQGFAVLGFPTNDFGDQEPGTNEEIAAFCTGSFGVDFPMFAKITVKGEDKHPLYAHLIQETGEEVQWNFNKYLVDKEGKVLRWFESKVEPLSDEMIQAIEAIL